MVFKMLLIVRIQIPFCFEKHPAFMKNTDNSEKIRLWAVYFSCLYRNGAVGCKPPEYERRGNTGISLESI